MPWHRPYGFHVEFHVGLGEGRSVSSGRVSKGSKGGMKQGGV